MTSTPWPNPNSPVESSVVLSIGSNLGDREAILREAVASIARIPSVAVIAVSGIVETAAVKLQGVDRSAPSYLNAAVTLRTGLGARELLGQLQRIEHEHGRVRNERWGDRTLDIDIVAMNGDIIDEPGLTVPHPRAAERVFVLAPWLELEPDATIALLGPVSELLERLDEPYRRYPAKPLL